MVSQTTVWKFLNRKIFWAEQLGSIKSNKDEYVLMLYIWCLVHRNHSFFFHYSNKLRKKKENIEIIKCEKMLQIFFYFRQFHFSFSAQTLFLHCWNLSILFFSWALGKVFSQNLLVFYKLCTISILQWVDLFPFQASLVFWLELVWVS